MKNQVKVIQYKNKEYIVAITEKNEPFIFDKDKLRNVSSNVIYFKNNNYICCRLESNTYLHHQIITDYEFNGELYIDHINRITSDNRNSNLRLITQSEQNKNQSKQKRTTILPDNCGINPQDIPTFIWYIKLNGSHGDRWCIEIKDKFIQI